MFVIENKDFEKFKPSKNNGLADYILGLLSTAYISVNERSNIENWLEREVINDNQIHELIDYLKSKKK